MADLVRAWAVFGLLGTATAASAQLPDSAAAADSAVADSGSVVERLPPEALVHVEHIAVALPGTPSGDGLVGTGLAEVRIALRYARLAGQDSTNLSAMTRNMVHVIHALDPTRTAGGNGLGYGLKRAAQGVVQHIDLATAVPDLPPYFVFHAAYARGAAEATVRGVDQAVDLARRIERSDDVRAARRSIRELIAMVTRLGYGADLDRDGRIGYTENEMGLAQAGYHLTLVRRVFGGP